MESREEIIHKIDTLNDYIWELRASPSENQTTEELLNESIKDALNINYRYGYARAILNLGMGAFVLKNEHERSLQLLQEAYDIFKALNNNKWISNSLLTLSIITNSIGSPETALYNALKGIDFYEKNQTDDRDVMMAYYVIGTVYKDLKKYDEAEAYYLKGVRNNYEPNSWTARIYTGLSNIHNERGEYQIALDYTSTSIDILRKEKNTTGESRALNDMGLIYRKIKDYPRSLEYLQKALDLRRSKNRVHTELGSYIDIADTHLEMGDLENALKNYHLAEPIAINYNHTGKLAALYQNMASIYKTTGKLPEAIHYFEKLIELNTEIFKKEKEQKINESQNSVLQEKIQEIERLKNVELKNAYELISEKNKEILDSLHYAKRIQNALLASEDLLNNSISDHFILFEPRDIVSGDFYWAASRTSTTGDLFYLAVCDSTGHGVPGAFMSLLNITFLDEAITEKGITEPHLIFNYVRERIIQTVSQDGAQDGMDGILICIKKGDPIIKYAAANNAPILANGEFIKDLECDKMPVGKGEFNNSFRSFEIELKENDALYLLTDGFADQFGGVKGKKFKHKNLIEKLNSIQSQTLSNQLTDLKATFSDWKGDLEQVDDVCIIGIKL